MAKQFTLGKNERLKSRKQIELLFSEGQRFSIAPFRVFYSLRPQALSPDDSLKAGFGASSRNFKTAVDRNRIKRLTREAWRLQKKELQVCVREQQLQLHVFLIFTARELPDYEAVFSCVSKIIARLLMIVDTKS